MEQQISRNAESVSSEKNSKVIAYSPKIFENESEPKIYFYDLKEGDSKSTGVFVFRYKINNIPQEVVMGKMKLGHGASSKAKDIIEYMEKQLRDNSADKTDFTNLNNLMLYIKKNEISFSLTMEGSDIVSSVDKEDSYIMRTYYIDDSKDKEMTLNCLYDELEMEKLKKLRKQQKEIEEQKRIAKEKWAERKKIILKNMTDPRDKILFLQGEKITKILEEDKKSKILFDRKNDISDFIIQNYESEILKKENEENGVNIPEYIKLKEKGIAIDSKIILEYLQDKCFKVLEEQGREPTEKEGIELDRLDSYERFMELIKTDREQRARILAIKYKNIDFEHFSKFMEKYANGDMELPSYIQKKGIFINQVQAHSQDEISNSEEKDNAKDLCDFLLHSSIRKYTKEDDENVLLQEYEIMKKFIAKDNIEALKKYNSYAEESKIYTYPVPEAYERDEEKVIIPERLRNEYKLTENDLEMSEKIR